MKKSEKEALVEKLIMTAVLQAAPYPHSRPGQIIKRLNDEDREKLKELTTEDFNRRIK